MTSLDKIMISRDKISLPSQKDIKDIFVIKNFTKIFV